MLFDGVCNLCNATVQFLIRRDRRGVLRFAALQSEAAARILGDAVTRDILPDSFVLVESGNVYFRSSAALRVARRLGFPWSLAWGLVIVPRPLRDWAYDVIARHRYRWFGKRDQCMVPTPEIRARFLD